MRKRNKLYTSKDVRSSLMLTIMFLVLYLGAWLGIYAVSSDELAESIEQFELMEVLSWFWWFNLPVLIVISLYMCIERYLYVELRSGEKNHDTKSKVRIYASIAVIMLLGIEFFRNILYVSIYLIEYWKMRGMLYYYIEILLLVVIGWLFCMVYTITKGRAMFIRDGGSNIWVIIMAVLIIALIFVSRFSIDYAGRHSYEIVSTFLDFKEG